MNAPLLKVLDAKRVTRAHRRPVDREAIDIVAGILADIESRGESAVLEHAVRLGDLRPREAFVHDAASLRAALDRIAPEERALLERVAGRIRTFAEAQRACLRDLEVTIEGGRAGHTCVPVRAAGCYAPGGRFPLPSSVLMTAVTARVAGVSRVWVASPRPTDATLAAAAIAGADGLLAIGGAQAIGALAAGLCGAATCDMIVGPGNRWVTAAKYLISDRVGIDMLAGPSELLVLADGSADPATIAADLLAQAEHDEDAVPMLVTTSGTLPGKVEAKLQEMLEDLPTRSTAAAALRNGFAVNVPDMEAAVALCDRLAPEHLEIMTRDAAAVAERLGSAGAVFIGAGSAEVFGDYGAGPNHVLPTGGTARFRAGLSVFAFLRPRTWLEMRGSAGSGLVRDSASLARIESLEAHAKAAEIRGRSGAGA